MSDAIIVTSAFIISFLLHVVLYRLFCRNKISSLYSVFAYAIGLIILIVVAFFRILQYPITSFIIYCSAAICVGWLSFGSYLGGETPSSMMLTAFEKHHALTRQQFHSLFTPYGLVTKRVNDLCRSGLVIKRKQILFLTAKGKRISAVINRYQYIFNRKERG